MTERIKNMLKFIRGFEHHSYRQTIDFPSAESFQQEGVSDMERVTISLKRVLEQETPIVHEWESILFWRTVSNLPEILTSGEWQEARKKYFIHESGRLSNFSPAYAPIIASGLLAVREDAKRRHAQAQDEEQARFYHCVAASISAILDLTERYRQEALRVGNTEAAALLGRVPAYGAATFHEALQALRILHYALWCEGDYHNTLGRFDQYMFPYLQADLEAGRLTEYEAFELLEEFFLCLNRDSDLYPGIQQGDNGQSMMLGGVDSDGKQCFNRLSEMCLDASRELALIDPKINLRVDKNTPLWIYEKGTQLTKAGLGFPQYSNDDVVIPGLVQKGYKLADARDYAVAACWEFIIPGKGADIPNIAAVNFPKLVSDAILQDLESCSSYEEFFASFKKRLDENCHQISESINELYFAPGPFLSILMDGCLERGEDISKGNRYNNFGYHGVGISTAVDSLATVKKLLFETHEISVAEAKALVLDDAIDSQLLSHLRYAAPKFGDNDDLADDIAVALLAAFADAVEPLRNARGGCTRAGTGSAMFYLWYADNVGNALSGHRKGEGFAANYAPELFMRNEPLSVISSFTKPNLERVVNGGPLTMEFHSSIFQSEAAIQKIASLIQAFVANGGHQLQLNSVNRDTMLAAQAAPELYRNLIVRIWGWSAYFIELDKEYQDHVIARQEFLI